MKPRQGGHFAAGPDKLGRHDQRQRSRSRHHGHLSRQDLLGFQNRLRTAREHDARRDPAGKRNGKLAHAGRQDHRIGL